MSNSDKIQQVGMYKYYLDGVADPAIWQVGSACDADRSRAHHEETPGYVVGSSEWISITEEMARRICAALTLFDGISTEELERLANAAVSGG